jgi:hypothetical protein
MTTCSLGGDKYFFTFLNEVLIYSLMGSFSLLLTKDFPIDDSQRISMDLSIIAKKIDVENKHINK